MRMSRALWGLFLGVVGGVLVMMAIVYVSPPPVLVIDGDKPRPVPVGPMLGMVGAILGGVTGVITGLTLGPVPGSISEKDAYGPPPSPPPSDDFR
jgi:hypothetical protein